MQKAQEWISECDVFAEPVHLSFKGNSRFQTVCGGLLTIILGVAMVGLLGDYFYVALFDPTFNSVSQLSIEPIYKNFTPINVTTTNSTVAVFIDDDQYDPEFDYFRVMFKQNNTYFPAAYCQDLYQKEIDDDAGDGFFKYANEWHEGMICPDTTNLTVNNVT